MALALSAPGVSLPATWSGGNPVERRHQRDMNERTRDYELVVIAVPQLEEQGVTALTERIAGWITAGGGAVVKSSVWGRRPLAYTIRKFTDGIYVQINYQLAPSASRELERNLRLDEQIIRHLIVRLDEE